MTGNPLIRPVENALRPDPRSLLALSLSACLLLVGGTVSAQTDTTADPFALPVAGAGAGLSVIDTPGVAPDEIDLTPVIEAAAATVAALPAEDWYVAKLAATLPDQDAAFRLVRDRIAFDAYAGELRGAAGTLGARAGNAFDRALLLKALLDAQGQTTRFAFGTLDEATATALVTRSLEPATDPLPAAPASPLDPTFEASVAARAARDQQLLLGALGDRLTTLTADGTAAAIADVAAHAWVQAEQADGTWLDLDPSMPDAEPGTTLTTADATANTIPAAATHAITLRVIAETLEDGVPAEAPLLDVAFDAASIAEDQVTLLFQPSSGGGGLLGVGSVWGGGGGDAYAPILVVGGTAWEGQPIGVSATSGGGLLGGGSTIDLASLRLEVDLTAPGGDVTTVRHELVDRVPSADRAAGTISAETLLPVADVAGTPSVFTPLVHVMVSTGGTDPRSQAELVGSAATIPGWAIADPAAAGARSVTELLAPEAIGDATLVVASEQRFVPAIDAGDVRAYVAAPRVYLSTRGVDLVDPSRETRVTDLASDGIRTLPRPGAAADAVAVGQLWYGALQAAAETELALLDATLLDPASRTLDAVSLRMAEPLTVIGSGDAMPLSADDRLSALLDAGGIAVVPGDVAGATTWWEIAADGATRSVLAPAMGGVGGVGGGGKPPKVLPPGPPQGGQNGRNPNRGQGQAGNEYGTLVGEVATNEVPVASRVGHTTVDVFERAATTLSRTRFPKI